jgi:hypothetical protein
VRLEGGSYQEQSLFADCLHELVGEVDNPRYLILRRDRSLGYERRDYHPVPLLLGVRKERARLLYQAWRRRVGPGELVYTRAPESRGLLLQARARSFATAARRAARRVDRWT